MWGLDTWALEYGSCWQFHWAAMRLRGSVIECRNTSSSWEVGSGTASTLAATVSGSRSRHALPLTIAPLNNSVNVSSPAPASDTEIGDDRARAGQAGAKIELSDEAPR
jgi:hypothetical protein